ncbi:MAG: hypothetical protein ATN36_03525 [Epulopiscium sp. Nele67-Bin005]|nr:MAG: hypothetical protein ATN36_03525 [Epulopiscium sp. Nele67-Bin005]
MKLGKFGLKEIALVTSLILASKSLNKNRIDQNKEKLDKDKVDKDKNEEQYEQASGVIFTVLGLDGETIVVPEILVPLKEDDTILDVTVRALDSANIKYELDGVGKNATLTSVEGITQKASRPPQAWLYRVDGEFPEEGPALYEADTDERIEWVFSTDGGATIKAPRYLFIEKENNLINLK